MTSTVIEVEPLADLTELTEALRAVNEPLPADAPQEVIDEKGWLTGYVIGWLAAAPSAPQDVIDMVADADNVPFSAPYDIPSVISRWGLLGTATHGMDRPRFMWAAGVLSGWKDGTARRPDANDCTLCERRVLLNTQGVTCEHGVFCDETCHRAMCDDPRCYEPEFDKDRYYADKYGDDL